MISAERQPNILIVEDDPTNLFVAKKLLGKKCHISSATNDREAFDQLHQKSFDVVLMDINLGGDSLDGVSILRHIRELYPHWNMPIFAVTSYAMPEDRAKYLHAGFNRYFPKPIDRDGILLAIQEEMNSQS